jgi:predicted transcriptional regulator
MSSPTDDDMLPTASWFHSADRSILRFYGEHQHGKFECGPGAAARNVSISEGHASRRIKKLTEARLLEQRNRTYIITDLGMRYVNGGIDTEELESLNPETEE